MNSYSRTPFNIDLLLLDKSITKYMGKVSRTTIFSSNSSDFDSEGLFSSEIFGAVGTPKRSITFGYVDLAVKVFHPLIYSHLITMSKLYSEIMAGKKYAIFDEKIKDFRLSTIDEGETGYAFFVKHLPKVKLEGKGSKEREFKIKLVNKFKEPDFMLDSFLVLPAGLRDYTVSELGKSTEDEINTLYRKLISASTLLSNIKITPTNEKNIDGIRYRIQLAIYELYEYIRSLLDGKNKFIQGKWAKRSIAYGTRNVLTPSISNITSIHDKDIVTVDDTVVGLYQYIRCITPIAMNKIHGMFINSKMNTESNVCTLVNSKTMKTELLDIPVKKRDEWVTLEGLDKKIGKLKLESFRKEPVMVGSHYLCLVYDKGEDFIVFNNTDEITNEYDGKYIRPITYYEMMLLAVYEIRNKYPAFFTRYPVANMGGTYPTNIYLRTTDMPLTKNIKVNGMSMRIREFPNYKAAFFNGMGPHNTHLDKLGADFDGDTGSLQVVFSRDSIEEIKNYINSKEYFINPSGGLTYSPVTDTLSYVTRYLADTL